MKIQLGMVGIQTQRGKDQQEANKRQAGDGEEKRDTTIKQIRRQSKGDQDHHNTKSPA
jgi:hypothetical protein